MIILKIWGIVALIILLLNVIRFRHQLAVYLFTPRRHPLDWPVWVYRLRRWFRLEWQEIKNRRDQVGGIVFVIAVLGLLFLSLVAGCPYE